MSASDPGQPVRPRVRIQDRPVAPPVAGPPAAADGARPEVARAAVFDIRDMSVRYGTKRALDWTTMKIYRNDAGSEQCCHGEKLQLIQQVLTAVTAKKK